MPRSTARSLQPTGRLYLTAESGIYAIGDPDAPFSVASGRDHARRGGRPRATPRACRSCRRSSSCPPARRPASGCEPSTPTVACSASARASWSVDGLVGASVSADGTLSTSPDAATQGGRVVAAVDGLTASAQVRVFEPLPWSENFESGRTALLDRGRAPSERGLHRRPAGAAEVTVAQRPAPARGLRRSGRHVRLHGPGRRHGQRVAPTSSRHRRPQQRLHARSPRQRAAAADPVVGRRAPGRRAGGVRVGAPTRWYTLKLRVDVGRRPWARPGQGVAPRRAGAGRVDGHGRGPAPDPTGRARLSSATRRSTSISTTSG